VHEWAEFAAQALDMLVQWREARREEMEMNQQQEHDLAADLEL
jgi:hypothetical protein